MIAKGTNAQIGVFPNYSYDDITVGDYANEYTYLLPLKDSSGERTLSSQLMVRLRNCKPVFHYKELPLSGSNAQTLRLYQQFF